MKLRPEVQGFAEAMERKLRKNDSKTSWRDETDVALLQKLHIELLELCDALELRDTLRGVSKGEAVRGEAVDVANFAMMIWCQYET